MYAAILTEYRNGGERNLGGPGEGGACGIGTVEYGEGVGPVFVANTTCLRAVVRVVAVRIRDDSATVLEDGGGGGGGVGEVGVGL